MGFVLARNWYDYSIIWVIIFSLLMLISCCVSLEDASSADSFGGFVHKFINNNNNKKNNSVPNPKTGLVYNITLPSNFSGVQVSYVRFRSAGFWARGANLRWVSIPPRVTVVPFVKRIAIVFENFGNWSSSFFHVPGHTLVAPVIGFTVYDSASNSTTLGKKKLHLHIMGGGQILVKFHHKVEFGDKGIVPQCVKFGAGGGFQLKNMTGPSLCSATDYGHFSLVIPNPPLKEKKKGVLWEWWVVGFGGGLIGLGLMGLVLIWVLRVLRMRNIEVMEKAAEREVSFDTVWIGKSRMPSASMVRTLPSLENSYVP